VIKQLTKLFNKVKNPKARASIIWVVGEYVDKVSTYAPDILRQLAKEFIESDDTVKNQILNLGAKLMIKNPEQTALIVQYILNLAKFDANYDIRDKARMMRHILMNTGEKLPSLNSHAKALYITVKPAPVIPLNTNARFMVGSLAQVINQTTPGYIALSDWQDTVQNSELRKVEEIFVEPSPVHSFAKPYARGQGDANDLRSFLGEGEEEWEEGEYDENGENFENGEYDENGVFYEYEEGEYWEEGETEFYGEEGEYEYVEGAEEDRGEGDEGEAQEEGYGEDGEAIEEEEYGDDDFGYVQN